MIYAIFSRAHNLVQYVQIDIVLTKQRPSEVEEEYNRRSELPPYQDYATLSFFGVAYDAMWAMAVGLHDAAVRVSNHNDSGCDDLPGEITPLEQFYYSNQKMGCILRHAFEHIHFQGVTVSVAVIQVIHVIKCFITHAILGRYSL